MPLRIRRHAMYDIGRSDAPERSRDRAAWLRLEAHCTTERAPHAVTSMRGTLSQRRSPETWRQLSDADGRPFDSWPNFAMAPHPHGLGLSAESLDAIENGSADDPFIWLLLGMRDRAQREPDTRRLEGKAGKRLSAFRTSFAVAPDDARQALIAAIFDWADRRRTGG